jgi:hypothetical protein
MNEAITAFCANCQEDKPHSVDVQPNNGEVTLTCDCSRFIKLPAGMEAADAKEYLKAHKESNQGQISVEKMEDAKNKLVAAFQNADKKK